jgi:hypothetical protein
MVLDHQGEGTGDPNQRGGEPQQERIREEEDQVMGGRGHPSLPKYLFPIFQGKEPGIWLAKCQDYLKGKCALGPFLSILVIKCKHRCQNVKICPWMNKVQITSKGMFLSLSTLVLCTNILSKC